ncbi:hypothetical protein LMG6871_02816 [Ralstonia edaphis]|uniref:acyltransferase family protein n=1 Tax=Ralstonia edaphi TaxID=3058599 RepID=UPI0028F67AE1|nr:acyltransferase [Ralstonia sp. LMG 6871]CAJ0719364.1 hypothetical protein LMG6871_02816 [Ralstonia sp. LMG 6871]
MQTTSRLHELDSLRALAAIGVIGWHYTNHFGASPLPHLMAPFYRHGLLLVHFFFVLSGFVLARAYWKPDAPIPFGRSVWQRVARLYPLHLATLIGVAAMQWYLVSRQGVEPFIYTHNDTKHFLLNLALLNSTGLEKGFSFNATSWSISTEMIVNVIFFAVILLPRRAASAVMLAMLCLAAVIVVLQNQATECKAALCYVNMGVYITIVGFFVGVGAYRFYVRHFEEKPLPPAEADLGAVLLIATAIGYFCGQKYSVYSDLAMTLFVFPAIILATLQSRIVKRALNVRALVYLGTISYSIYLVHFPLQLLMRVVEVRFAVAIPYDRWYILLGFIAGTIAVAALTYRFIERPGKTMLASFWPASTRTAVSGGSSGPSNRVHREV